MSSHELVDLVHERVWLFLNRLTSQHFVDHFAEGAFLTGDPLVHVQHVVNVLEVYHSSDYFVSILHPSSEVTMRRTGTMPQVAN